MPVKLDCCKTTKSKVCVRGLTVENKTITLLAPFARENRTLKLQNVDFYYYCTA